MEEEVVLLEEQLAAAHADVERLQAALEQVEARTSSSEGELTQLRDELAEAKSRLSERDIRLAALAEEAEALRTSLGETEERERAAAQRYRNAVLAKESELPADLVVGDSVEAIDESLARARETVAQVRQHLEQQAHSLRVPAGAPVRSGPDFSGLSSAEKIRLGLQQT